jgi:hypothetical protein
MSGQVLAASTVVPSAAVVAALPNTGAYRPLFIAALVVLTVSLTALVATSVAAMKRRATKA